MLDIPRYLLLLQINLSAASARSEREFSAADQVVVVVCQNSNYTSGVQTKLFGTGECSLGCVRHV